VLVVEVVVEATVVLHQQLVERHRVVALEYWVRAQMVQLVLIPRHLEPVMAVADQAAATAEAI
jgi:hypothetical protein